MEKTTNLFELEKFDIAATSYLVSNEFLEKGAYTKKEPTKIVASIKFVLKQYAEKYRSHKEEIDIINISNSLEDVATKEILRDAQGRFKYSKEGMLKRNEEIKALFSKETTIKPRIVEGFDTSDLSEEQIEAFTGFVI